MGNRIVCMVVALTMLVATGLVAAFAQEVVLDDLQTAIGDINGDTLVNSADAQLALRAVTGKLTLNQIQINSADVDRNGRVDSVDALRILLFSVGKLESLVPSSSIEEGDTF